MPTLRILACSCCGQLHVPVHLPMTEYYCCHCKVSVKGDSAFWGFYYNNVYCEHCLIQQAPPIYSWEKIKWDCEGPAEAAHRRHRGA